MEADRAEQQHRQAAAALPGAGVAGCRQGATGTRFPGIDQAREFGDLVDDENEELTSSWPAVARVTGHRGEAETRSPRV